MANFRGISTKSVPLYVAAYDKSVARDKETGEPRAQYVTAGIIPEAEQAKDQTQLALNSKKEEYKGKTQYNNSAPYSVSQFDQIKEAAGDNVAPLKNKEGETVGQVYGVQADVFPARDGSGMTLNTKSLESTDFSVKPLTKDGEVSKNGQGHDIQSRIVDTQRDNKAAKVAAKPAAEAESQAEAQTEAEAETETEPSL